MAHILKVMTMSNKKNLKILVNKTNHFSVIFDCYTLC